MADEGNSEEVGMAEAAPALEMQPLLPVTRSDPHAGTQARRALVDSYWSVHPLTRTDARAGHKRSEPRLSPVAVAEAPVDSYWSKPRAKAKPLSQPERPAGVPVDSYWSKHQRKGAPTRRGR